jgi:hypothetical protein
MNRNDTKWPWPVPCLVPENVRTIIDLIGLSATIKLVEAYGGTLPGAQDRAPGGAIFCGAIGSGRR